MSNLSLENNQAYENFCDFLIEIKSSYGNLSAVRWYDRHENEYSRTFTQLVNDITIIAVKLKEKSLANKHIAIIGENSYEWLVMYYAIATCGGVSVCIDAEQSEGQIISLIAQADVEAAFLSDTIKSIGENAKKQNNRLLDVFSFSQVKDILDKVSPSDNMNLEQFRKGLSADKDAAIVYTSGTTGISKPVLLSHSGLLINGAESNYYVDGGRKAFSALPFCHTYGMTCAVIATWERGAELIFNGNLRMLMRDLKLSKADSMLTVPLIVEAIHNQLWLNAKQSGKDDKLRKIISLEKFKRKIGIKKQSAILEGIREKALGTIKVLICGGANMCYEISEEMEILGVTLLQGYGITECSPLVAVNGNDHYKLESVGQVLPSCKVKIVDEEIYVTGKTVMNGYYNLEEETEAVMEGEWFKTGDIGHIDKDGFLHITGRKKNIIVFKNGKKISPETLEEKIRQFPLVKDVLVYGAVSGLSADDVKVTASIFPDTVKTSTMSSYEILEELQKEIDKINDTLPLYQQIQMINIRDQEFDKTSMMKIKRHMV